MTSSWLFLANSDETPIDAAGEPGMMRPALPPQSAGAPRQRRSRGRAGRNRIVAPTINRVTARQLLRQRPHQQKRRSRSPELMASMAGWIFASMTASLARAQTALRRSKNGSGSAIDGCVIARANSSAKRSRRQSFAQDQSQAARMISCFKEGSFSFA
jgi:hypothetical protein